MSLEIKTQNRFEKDARIMKKRNKDMHKLKKILYILSTEQSISQKYKNHKLSGNYKNYWKLHIEPDWLLIYKKTKTAIICERTESHSDLF